MNIIRISILTLISIFLASKSYGQALSANEALELAEDLNLSVAEVIGISLNKNQAILKFNEIDQKLDIRTKSAITLDSISKK